MSIICIITARGGSKRIPKKNIKEFCGEPIISYSIEAALKSHIFDHVMVSTDDTEIAEISKKYGAEVPFLRSEKTSDDYSTTEDVLVEVIEEYELQGVESDYVCCLYPTAPFVTADRIREAYVKLINTPEANIVFPVVSFSFPPQRSLHQIGELLYPVYSCEYMKRSQDLETLYHDAGQFYIFRKKQFMETKCMSDRISPIILNELEVQDIDNEIDWKLAEIKYKMREKEWDDD